MNLPRPKSATRACLAMAGLAILFVMVRKLAVQMGRLDDDLSVYYHASNLLTSGSSPYVGRGYVYYIYPPVFAWLISPLAVLSPAGYAIGWGLLLGACWLATVLLSARLIGDEDWTVTLLPSLLLFRAVWNGWGHGQPTLLISALVLAALVRERQGRPHATAFWLGLASAIKLFPAFLALVLVRPLRRRGVLAFVACVAVVSALPLLTCDGRFFVSMIFKGFIGSALRCVALQQAWITVNQAIVPHVIGVVRGGADPLLCRVVGLVWLAMLALSVLASRRPREDSGRDRMWLAWLVTTMVAACPHVFMHYLTLLVFPFAAAIAHIREHPDAPGTPVLFTGLALASIAFNASATWVVSPALSNALDATGVHAAGLLVFWASLGWVVLRAPAVAAEEIEGCTVAAVA